MPISKRRALTRGNYWNSLTDDQLLSAELTTDDPDCLENLVSEIPAGDEEPYVEFKYDLRGSGRQEEFVCVHGHHRHLAGFVMRKGKWRFKVGWICGNNIYGEDFDQYTADFDAALNRREMLKRRREIENAMRPFMGWLEQVAKSDVFKQHDRVRRQFYEHMPWIWENMPRMAFLDTRVTKTKIPRTMFDVNTDPEVEFGKICTEFSTGVMTMLSKSEQGGFDIGPVKRRMELLLNRLDVVLSQLQEVVDFFQPSTLDAICKFATEHDHPKKRSYVPGLGSITCKRERTKLTLHMPNNYRLPERRGIENFRAVLRGFKLE